MIFRKRSFQIRDSSLPYPHFFELNAIRRANALSVLARGRPRFDGAQYGQPTGRAIYLRVRHLSANDPK
jgi:hypothetical protein